MFIYENDTSLSFFCEIDSTKKIDIVVSKMMSLDVVTSTYNVTKDRSIIYQ